jgi:hypothetical protein
MYSIILFNKYIYLCDLYERQSILGIYALDYISNATYIINNCDSVYYININICHENSISYIKSIPKRSI